MTGTRAIYEFGEFELHVAGQRLQRRGDTADIALTSKVFETLLCLVEHAGETLDKDTLLRSVWPDVIVEENSLTQNISTLRQVLGEARGENRYIATIARKGYRFVAQVTQRDASITADTATPTIVTTTVTTTALASPPSRRWLFAGIAAFVVAIGIGAAFALRHAKESPGGGAQTLAILPFKPLVSAERNESLELGMTESLIASLSANSPQVIRPLSSVRRYGGLDEDPIAAGRALGVDTVLEGSLQRRDDRLRVSARLLRVADGRQLWAQTFDQDFTTIFAVQDAIAAKVAQALSVRWGKSSSERGSSSTQNAQAYVLYTSGRFAWTRQTEASLLQAIEFFDQAIKLDPGYALAYCGLADSYALLGVFGIRAPHEVFPAARRAAEQALAIDPALAAAHSALGHIKVQYDHDWQGAEREYARAMELDPSVALSHHRYGLLYAMQGHTDRAIASAEKAHQLEPLWLAPRGAAASYLYYARRYDESIRMAKEVLALDERADNARSVLIRDFIAIGEYARALEEIDKRPVQAPGSNAFRGQALALAGRSAEATVELNRVLKLSQERFVPAYDIALIHVALADTENALQSLERAVKDRSTLVVFVAQDPSFDALHAHPRFLAVVREVGIGGDATLRE